MSSAKPQAKLPVAVNKPTPYSFDLGKLFLRQSQTYPRSADLVGNNF